MPSPSATACYTVCSHSFLISGQKNTATYFKMYAKKHTEICGVTELAALETQLSPFPDLDVQLPTSD